MTKAETTTHEDRLTEAVDRHIAAIERVTGIPAQTAEGIRAKANMVSILIPRDAGVFELGPDSYQLRLVLSLASDVMRGVA